MSSDRERELRWHLGVIQGEWANAYRSGALQRRLREGWQNCLFFFGFAPSPSSSFFSSSFSASSSPSSSSSSSSSSPFATITPTPTPTTTTTTIAVSSPSTSSSFSVSTVSTTTSDTAPSATSSQITVSPPNPSLQRVVLSANDAKGLEIKSSWRRASYSLYMDLTLTNHSTATQMNNFALKFNVNYAGVAPAALFKPAPLSPGQSTTFSLPIKENNDSKNLSNAYGLIQIAIKTDMGVFYFNDCLEAFYLFNEDGKLAQDAFLSLWRSLSETTEVRRSIEGRTIKDIADTKRRLCSANVFYVASHPLDSTSEQLYFSLMLKGTPQLLELTFTPSGCSVVVKSSSHALSSIALAAITSLLTRNDLFLPTL
eukprot:TRINITY_DN476_c0_g1_i3.p1 TRINITY_DN476_c0_g1~~TRINITY_DN476_c0_g1_i3.p1  ORF type:complete len:370 (-),score=124.68 TRINITY_DN476_c0_g1_i3:166-1275(-)